MKAINECGIFRYLTKPWNEAEMNMTIKQALDTYRLRKENSSLIGMLKEANQPGRKSKTPNTKDRRTYLHCRARFENTAESDFRALLHIIQLEFP